MKPHYFDRMLVVVGLVITLSAHATVARPLDATGPCDGGGALSIAVPPYQGTAPTLLKNTAFARAHHAASINEANDIKLLKWKSGPNRVYRDGNQTVIIATMCSPIECDDRDYIAFDPVKNLYGGAIYEGGHVREYGSKPSDPTYEFDLGGALTCARNADWASSKK